MKDCFIIRRGGSGSGSKAKPNMLKGVVQIEGSFNPITPDIGQDVILEPYVSDSLIIYEYTNTTELEKSVSFNEFSYVVPYSGQEKSINNIDGENTIGYYNSDGNIIYSWGIGDVTPITEEGVIQTDVNDFYLNKIIVNKANTLLFSDRSRYDHSDYIDAYQEWYKKNSGTAICFIVSINDRNVPFLISKDENAVEMEIITGLSGSSNTIFYNFYYNNQHYYLGKLDTGITWDSSIYGGAVILSQPYYHYGARLENMMFDENEENLNIPSLGGLVFQILDNFGQYL